MFYSPSRHRNSWHESISNQEATRTHWLLQKYGTCENFLSKKKTVSNDCSSALHPKAKEKLSQNFRLQDLGLGRRGERKTIPRWFSSHFGASKHESTHTHTRSLTWSHTILYWQWTMTIGIGNRLHTSFGTAVRQWTKITTSRRPHSMMTFFTQMKWNVAIMAGHAPGQKDLEKKVVGSQISPW